MKGPLIAAAATLPLLIASTAIHPPSIPLLNTIPHSGWQRPDSFSWQSSYSRNTPNHTPPPPRSYYHYNTLSVPPTAPLTAITKAYRKLCTIHHPDKGGNRTAFDEICAAYAVLSDPMKRRLYDQFGDEATDSFIEQVSADHCHCIQSAFFVHTIPYAAVAARTLLLLRVLTLLLLRGRWLTGRWLTGTAHLRLGTATSSTRWTSRWLTCTRVVRRL